MADRPIWRLLAIRGALGVSIAVAAVSGPTFAGLAKGFNQLDAPDVALMQFAIAAFPYGVLIATQASWRAWAGAACITALAWGFFTYEVARPYEGGGANIGLGLLMLASPAFVLLGAAIGSWLLRPR